MVNIEFKKNLEYGYRSTGIFQMRFNKHGKWYNIHRSNIVFEGDVALQSQLANAAIQGLVCRVKGSYDRRAKKLTIHLEGGD